MPSLDIKQFESAADGSSITFQDQTDWSAAGMPKRNEVVLFAFLQKLGQNCEDSSGNIIYFNRHQTTFNTGPFRIDPAYPEDANLFKIPISEGGVFSLYVFALPRKGALIEATGSDFIGNVYYDITTRTVNKVVASHPITMTDVYARSFHYLNLQDLINQETLQGVKLVPHFTYDYEPLTQLDLLLDTNYVYGIANIMNQLPYRKALSSWWMQMYRNSHCLNETEKKSYDYYLFDLEGACSRFEAEYFNDAAEILCSLDSRTPTPVNC